MVQRIAGSEKMLEKVMIRLSQLSVRNQEEVQIPELRNGSQYTGKPVSHF